MKVYIVGGPNHSGQYGQMFKAAGFEIVDSIRHKPDLVCFTGGEDVTPEIYGQENTSSYNSFDRDLYEAGFFAIAKRMGIPMVGICRGGQFLNVMCGGEMIQHVEGHALYDGHDLYLDYTGRMWNKENDFHVSSTHHQMMVRAFDKGDLIGWAEIVGERDPEIIHYPEDKVLCFQPHPEFPGYEECTELFFKLINELLL